ncbi:MAG: CDP-glucose 4,6-dehydratase [Spirochaetaceae bacterium]|jgi:CDP-glucose 4,6-dehydratase|nr:CDP-glucose 4,6-dehydratase [Spirochaetaceae bacterium]
MRDLAFYRDKKILITGHSGFKGSWLCTILTLAGADVSGYALESPTMPSLFAQTGLADKIYSIAGDVRNREALLRAVREAEPEIVFHLAAQPLVRLSYREPAETYETNVMGTVNVLEAVRLCPSVRSFVNVTTDKVYENKEWHWGYRENENLCGFDPYSNSKSCSELATYSYRNSFFNDAKVCAVSTARAGNVIGGGDWSKDRIIPDCVRAALAGETIIVRNPCSVRPYQHVLDCLSGYLLLAEKQWADKTLAGNYNFGPDEEDCVTTGAIVDLFCDAWGGGLGWTTEGPGVQPYESTFLKLDCSKAKKELNWKPRWNIRQAIEKTVEFSKLKTDAERADCVERQIKEYW